MNQVNCTKFDLIGHSSGGIILRLFLSDKEFNGKIYNGKSITSNLITLGSPHQAKRATRLRKYVEIEYPGNFFKEVNYVSVGGKLNLNSDNASLISKLLARGSYKSISGINNSEGDGLVPLSSSILKGSQEIIINETSHGKIFGTEWYGSPSKVKEWWNLINWNQRI